MAIPAAGGQRTGEGAEARRPRGVGAGGAARDVDQAGGDQRRREVEQRRQLQRALSQRRRLARQPRRQRLVL